MAKLIKNGISYKIALFDSTTVPATVEDYVDGVVDGNGGGDGDCDCVEDTALTEEEIKQLTDSIFS